MGEGPLYRGASRRHVFEAVEGSLRRLATDWIDLYQIHFPDVTTPIEETLRALDDIVRQGKVRYYGCSNFAGWQVVEAQWTTRTQHFSPLISSQNEYNLLDRRIERELVPACQEYGLGILPYFPLASGFLSGKYRQGEKPPEGTRIAAWGARGEEILSERNFAILSGLERFAEERGKTVLDVADRLAGEPAVRAERDSGGDEAGAGGAERQGGRMAADAGGDVGDGRDYEAAGLRFVSE